MQCVETHYHLVFSTLQDERRRSRELMTLCDCRQMCRRHHSVNTWGLRRRSSRDQLQEQTMLIHWQTTHLMSPSAVALELSTSY